MKKILGWLSLFLFSFILICLFTLAVYYIQTVGKASPPPTVGKAAKSIKFTKVKGIQLHYQTFGNPKNPHLYVLHSGPGYDYRYLLPLQALADSYHVIFYDQRGSGLSERVGKEKLNLQGFSLELQALLDQHSPNKDVILLGHGWGAMLASYYTSKHAKQIRALILAEPFFLSAKTGKSFLARTNYLQPRMDWALVDYSLRSVTESMHIENGDADATSDYVFAKMQQPTKANIGFPYITFFCDTRKPIPFWRYGYRAHQVLTKELMDAQKNILFNISKGIKNYSGETLFLSSECSSIGESFQKEHRKLFAASQEVVILQAGHYLLQDNPSQTLEQIRKFLQSVQ
ncbi:MAG: alpha/beta hydrolase [Spirochaetota bacterium]